MLFILYHEVPWKLTRISINKDDWESSNSQLQSLLLSNERDPEGVLTLCCSDKWFAPLFTDYANTEDEIRCFTLDAVKHFIVCLNEFFLFTHTESFEERPIVDRQYREFEYRTPKKVDMKQLVDKIKEKMEGQQEAQPSEEPSTSAASSCRV